MQIHRNQGYNEKIPLGKNANFALLILKYSASNATIKGTFKCKKQYLKIFKGIYLWIRHLIWVTK